MSLTQKNRIPRHYRRWFLARIDGASYEALAQAEDVSHAAIRQGVHRYVKHWLELPPELRRLELDALMALAREVQA